MPGKTERKIFTELRGPGAGELNEALGRIGFRRSQNVAYRPSCDNCHACVSIRVITDAFEPNATQRRLLKRNSDLEISACGPWSTEEQFALMQRYLADRPPDRKSVEQGKRVSVREDLGGRRVINKKQKKSNAQLENK